jgi:hypothetical protein
MRKSAVIVIVRVSVAMIYTARMMICRSLMAIAYGVKVAQKLMQTGAMDMRGMLQIVQRVYPIGVSIGALIA